MSVKADHCPNLSGDAEQVSGVGGTGTHVSMISRNIYTQMNLRDCILEVKIRGQGTVGVVDLGSRGVERHILSLKEL